MPQDLFFESGKSARTALANYFRELFEARALPKLHTCLLFGYIGNINKRVRERFTRLAYYATWDVVHNATTTIAALPVVKATTGLPISGDLYLLHDRDGTECFALEAEIPAFLEGHFEWETLPGGARAPLRRKMSMHYQPAPWKVHDRQGADRRWGMSNLDCALWEREKPAGCGILTPATRNGLDSIQVPEDQLPTPWEKFSLHRSKQWWKTWSSGARNRD